MKGPPDVLVLPACCLGVADFLAFELSLSPESLSGLKIIWGLDMSERGYDQADMEYPLENECTAAWLAISMPSNFLFNSTRKTLLRPDDFIIHQGV
jgi:hypothetical protein